MTRSQVKQLIAQGLRRVGLTGFAIYDETAEVDPSETWEPPCCLLRCSDGATRITVRPRTERRDHVEVRWTSVKIEPASWLLGGHSDWADAELDRLEKAVALAQWLRVQLGSSKGGAS